MRTTEAEPGSDLRAVAAAAGLRYVSDEVPGIRRRRAGASFTYLDPKGRALRNQAELKRIRSLAIPPAYRDVWICPHASGHIQATGRDARGRKQYRYHPRWREVRDSTKYEHVMEFARLLPKLRKTINKHMGLPGLPREKVLATVAHLLESTLIRVGNDDYARENQSYGLTTLQDRHVKVRGGEMRFGFRGKSGKDWKLSLHDRRVAAIVKQCQDLPGQELFQYLDEDGKQHDVTSQDVNDYLREISGRDITAKDFRTWAGTVLAAMALREFEKFDTQAAAKRNVRAAIERVAGRLGNTVAVCRKCYVHPTVLDSYLDGGLLLEVKEQVEGKLKQDLHALRPEEAAVLAFLRDRLAAETRKGAEAGKQAA